MAASSARAAARSLVVFPSWASAARRRVSTSASGAAAGDFSFCVACSAFQLAVLECCKSWNAAKTVHRKDWPRAWLTSSRGERNRSHHSFTLHSAHFSSAVSRILAFQHYRRCSERATARQVLRKKGAARLSLGAHTICGAEFADGSQDAKRNSRQQDDLSSSSS